MGNVLRILLRDLKRLLKAPAALIVAGALLVLPSLYTWYNVIAFWDPYNTTSNVKVCVVNQDAGTSNEMTGQLVVGDKLIEELQSNDKLGWVTDKDYDTAIEDLKTGKVYAVFVIPEDFSANLVSPLTGNVKTPHLEYYANEKLGPVSPKVTDTAASTLEQTINSTFVATVAEVATQAIDDAVKQADSDIVAAKTKASGRAEEAKAAVGEVRKKLSDIESSIDDARSKVAIANDAVGSASTIADDTRAILKTVSDEADELQSSLSKLSSKTVPKLSKALVKLTRVTEKASTLADSIATSTAAAQADVDMAAARIQPVINAMREIASELEATAASVPIKEISEKIKAAAQDLTARADEAQTVLDGTVALAEKAGKASVEATKTANAISEAVTNASNLLSQYSGDLNGSTTSTIGFGIAQVSSVCSQLSAAVSSLEAAVGQVRPILTELNGILGDSKAALQQTDDLVGGAQADLESAIADSRLLAQSDVITNLLENGTLNAENISAFMGSPTELSTTKLYHPNAYGTAMSPLFMNLSFWIGAFMLMIIFLLEVDSEGLKDPKPWQRYLGRFLLFSIFAVAQSAICCAGTLALGVEAANVPALFAASVVAELAFLSIIYFLSSTFRHVGKALCIILVFAQIPGASGLYPVEMTSSFYQAIYPLLPFTYGIDAIRESIGGFYGSYYLRDLLVLGGFFFGNLALGLLLGPLMSNVVRMTAHQIQEGDLYNGEDALTPARPYRLGQVLRALTEKEDYRKELEERYARFSRRYPIFIRGSIVLGVGVPVVIGFLLALDAAEKVTLLTFFLLWLVALIAFLVIVESQRVSFERQLSLRNMSDERLLRIYSRRNHMVHVNNRLGARSKTAATESDDSEEDEQQSGFKKLQAASRAKRESAGGIRNVWRIARRDFSGMFKNVMSVVITVGLVVLPSLFAWYNILACWNVFDNTSYLSVAVASEDEGFESDLLPVNVNVGEKVVSALRGNSQINWVFTDADDAVEGVKAGRYYAGLVIPKGFSRDMLTFYEGDSNSATIDYYVNEKKNAIAPNITGMGADAVSHEVNTTFVQTMSEVAIGVAQSLSKAAENGNADARLASLVDHIRNVSDRLDQSANVVGLYSSLGKNMQDLVQSGSEIVASSRERLQTAVSDIDAGKKRLRNHIDDLSNSVSKVSTTLEKANSAVAKLEERADVLIADASDKVSGIAKQLRDKASEIDAKAAKLSEIVAVLEEIRNALKSGTSAQMDIDIAEGEKNVKIDLGNGEVYESEKELSDDIDALSSAVSALQDAKASLESTLTTAATADQPALQNKINDIDAKIQNLKETSETLRKLLDSRTDIDVDIKAQLSKDAGAMVESTVILDKDIATLKKVIEILQTASVSCTDAADALEAGSADVEKKVNDLRASVTQTKEDIDAVKEDLKKGLESGAKKLKSDVATLVSDLERASDQLNALDPDLAGTLASVASALGDASSKVDEVSAKLHTAASKVRDLANSVDAALASGDVEKLRSLLQGSAGDLAAALTAPVQVERTALFPCENFGSAMAPLYCTLALFIGSLLIMVAMKPEVSRRGREELVDPKPHHLYFGRFMAVAAISLMQTTLLGLGNMLFLKVQVSNPFLFMLGCWFAGLVLAFMIYTLVVAFGNLGKAIAVLLLIVQVTACGGSYPLQMLPDFVQAISPWVPATYIVDILRAAMMGVYQNDYWVAMGSLALFIVPFLLLGLVLRKPMERFMKFYVSKVEECGIMG